MCLIAMTLSKKNAKRKKENVRSKIGIKYTY